MAWKSKTTTAMKSLTIHKAIHKARVARLATKHAGKKPTSAHHGGARTPVHHSSQRRR